MTAIVAYKNYDLEDTIAMGPKVNDWEDSSKDSSRNNFQNKRIAPRFADRIKQRRRYGAGRQNWIG